MKLYDDQRAPNPRRTRMFLAEKGFEIDKVPVDIATKENLGDTHRARNPLGLLPTLELEDGSMLTESIAICRYVEELKPEPPLFGRTPLERARVEEWNRIAELEVLLRVALVFQNASPFWAGRRQQSAEFAEQERARLMDRLELFERHLTDRAFLVGDSLTVADITLFVGLDFGKVIKLRLGDAHPALARFHASMAARPSAKA